MNLKPVTPPEIRPGAILVDRRAPETILILAAITSSTYACISLDDGNRFKEPEKTIKMAIEGLELVAHNARITITSET